MVAAPQEPRSKQKSVGVHNPQTCYVGVAATFRFSVNTVISSNRQCYKQREILKDSGERESVCVCGEEEEGR